MANGVDFESVLLRMLQEDAGLSALVGSKVFPLFIPSGNYLPCVTFQRLGGSHGDNGDRDRRLEHLSDFEPQIGRRSRKDDGHDDAHPDRIGRHFGGSGRRRQHRRVLLARRQLAVGVLRQRGQLFFLFHSRFLSLNSRLIDKVRNFFEKSIFRPPNSADPKGTA